MEQLYQFPAIIYRSILHLPITITFNLMYKKVYFLKYHLQDQWMSFSLFPLTPFETIYFNKFFYESLSF